MVKKDKQSLTEKLSEILWEIKDNPLPSHVIEKAKTCFLDFLAACFSGAKSNTASVGLSVLKAIGTDSLTLIGNKKKGSLISATFFNGMIAHAEELDDAHRYVSGLHLSATIFPAALAIGEKEKIDGYRFLKSIVAGYEIASRIGRAIDLGHRERGFHATGTVGPFGACAASGLLMDFTKEKLIHAFGIAGSMGAGIFAFLNDGATVKHLHTGRAASGGVLAALLAESGMTGPRNVLEAKEGFLNAYSNHFKIDEITRPLRDNYEISFAYHKIHSACGHSFPAIDAALLLKNDIHNQLSNIKCIKIKTYRAASALNKRMPESIHEARFSIPFLVGLALIKGRITRSELVLDTLNDYRIRKIASIVSVIEDRKIADNFPKFRSAELIATMADGRKIIKIIKTPLGMPDNPVCWEDIEEKFFNGSKESITPSRQSEIIKIIKKLETIRSMKEITSLLESNYNKKTSI